MHALLLLINVVMMLRYIVTAPRNDVNYTSCNDNTAFVQFMIFSFIVCEVYEWNYALYIYLCNWILLRGLSKYWWLFVPYEGEDNWIWFLKNLKVAISLNLAAITFVSYLHEGIVSSIIKVFPNSFMLIVHFT